MMSTRAREVSGNQYRTADTDQRPWMVTRLESMAVLLGKHGVRAQDLSTGLYPDQRRIIAWSSHTYAEVPVCRARAWVLCHTTHCLCHCSTSDKTFYRAHEKVEGSGNPWLSLPERYKKTVSVKDGGVILLFKFRGALILKSTRNLKFFMQLVRHHFKIKFLL